MRIYSFIYKEKGANINKIVALDFLRKLKKKKEKQIMHLPHILHNKMPLIEP